MSGRLVNTARLTLSGDVAEKEISFLRELRFKEKRPTPLYYYRELQNLRDPLHFRTGPPRGSVEPVMVMSMLLDDVSRPVERRECLHI